MTTLHVQIQRGDEWRNVTTVSVEKRRFDADGSKARATAFEEAQRQMTAWHSYDGFDGLPMRIAEQVGWGGEYREARP